MVDGENLGTGNNGAGAGTDNGASQPAPGSGATDGSAGGQGAGQSSPDSDLFKGIDPKTLPPSLKAAYDSMLSDYRTKTAGLSERVKAEAAKAVDGLKAKTSFYDSFTKDEKLVKMYNDYVDQLTASQNAGQNQPGSEADRELRQKLEQVELQVKRAEADRYIDAFIGAKDEKGQPLHGDFEKLQDISVAEVTKPDGSKTNYNLLRVAVELSSGATPQERLANGYKMAQTVYNSIFEAGKKAGMGRTMQKLGNSSMAPGNANGAGSQSVAPHAARNAAEALQFAREGLLPAR